MSNDALRSVLRQMSLVERLQLAAVDEELNVLATRWDDIDSLLVAERQFALGGKDANYAWIPENARHENLVRALTLCPSVRRLFVQTKFTAEDWTALSSKASTLQKLYISNENFTSLSEWGDLSFKRLRSLNILQRMDQRIRLTTNVNCEILKRVLCPSLTRVCFTGVVLSSNALQSIFSLPNLRSLDLIGAAVDSKETAQLVPKLGCPLSLEEISLPPSFFSFSNYANNKDVTFDFRWLKVRKICLYMEMYDETHFFSKTENMLAKETNVLVLYGNYIRAKNSQKMQKWKRCQVLYGPSVAQVMDPLFSPGSGLLVSHLVRHSPYSSGETNANVAESWRLDLSRETDEPPVRNQARDLRGGNLLQMLLEGLPMPDPPPAPPPPPRILAIEGPRPDPAQPVAVVDLANATHSPNGRNQAAVPEPVANPENNAINANNNGRIEVVQAPAGEEDIMNAMMRLIGLPANGGTPGTGRGGTRPQ